MPPREQARGRGGGGPSRGGGGRGRGRGGHTPQASSTGGSPAVTVPSTPISPSGGFAPPPTPGSSALSPTAREFTPTFGGTPAAAPSTPLAATTAPPSPGRMITETAGLPRVPPGSAGKTINVQTNHFKIRIGSKIVHHYDVITPQDKNLPSRAKWEIIAQMQTLHTSAFSPKCVYDGQANLYSTRVLPAESFQVPRDKATVDPHGRPQRFYTVKLTKVAEVNLESLLRVCQGKQASDPSSMVALNALNVVIRMKPQQDHPFNSKSFFTPLGSQDIGGGITLWRGYFQSVRLSIGTLLANVDISTAAMYKAGPLIDLCLNWMGRSAQGPQSLNANSMPMPLFNKLSKFVATLRVVITAHTQGTPKGIKRLLKTGPADYKFDTRDGKKMTVQQYVKQTYNKTLQFPNMIMAEIGTKAYIPLEMCQVLPGQFMKKEIPTELRKDILNFATKKPLERLQSIQGGWTALEYGQSEYVRDFGMEIDNKPVDVAARVLNAPTLLYKTGKVNPRMGAWQSGTYLQPCSVASYGILILDPRFRRESQPELIKGLAEAVRPVGISWTDNDPLVKTGNPQGDVIAQIRSLGVEINQRRKSFPDLIVVVLPDQGASEVRDQVKHFGDIMTGVATQCLLGSKAGRPKPGYFSNVMLKINVKRGGSNVRIDPSAATYFKEPTIVMGADVIHPPPGAQGRPSFASLVSSVDSACIKYIAKLSVQKARQEHIEAMEQMATAHLTMHVGYKKNVEKLADGKPRRILFYRDGVSEGQFAHVKMEVNAIKAAASKLGIDAKITAIVVGKRHHARFFPRSNDADRSGNCPAGTVIDNGLPMHPIDWDFYLYSHAGLLGTSRPTHYNPIVDENKFSNDQLQAMSFALCHIYARSTRSVSIPAPTYYADIVCSRWKHHYAPDFHMRVTDSGTIATDDEDNILKQHVQNFKPVNEAASRTMYFM